VKRSKPIIYAAAALLALSLQASAGEQENSVEFDGSVDQGVDSRRILQEVKGRADRESIGVKSAAISTHADKKTCKVNFKSARLELTADRAYGRAEYRIGEDCTPRLESVTY
jgi:hypothetical protein